MKKFIALYYANAGHQAPLKMTPEQQAEMMAPWGAWQAKYGGRLVDMGAPCMPASGSADGNSWAPSAKKVSGYSIVAAENLAAAQEMFKAHVIFNYPDHSIEISECVAM